MGNTDMNYREKTGVFLTSNFFVLETIVITSFLMWWLGGLGYILGGIIALITLWARKWDWSYFGLGDVSWGKAFILSLGYTILIIMINDFVIEPLTIFVFKQPIILDQFDFLRGNIMNLLLMLAFMWVVAGFGEEFFYRGYLMNRLAHLLGNNKSSWVIAVLLSSAIFGLTHAYQGISGMITTGTVGLILGIAFYRNRNNLLVGMFTHGIYDTYGLILIYLSKENIIKDLMIENIWQFLK